MCQKVFFLFCFSGLMHDLIINRTNAMQHTHDLHTKFKKQKTAQKERESSLTAENKSKNKVSVLCAVCLLKFTYQRTTEKYIILLANAMPFQLHIIAIHLYFVYAISCAVYAFHIHQPTQVDFIVLNV